MAVMDRENTQPQPETKRYKVGRGGLRVIPLIPRITKDPPISRQSCAATPSLNCLSPLAPSPSPPRHHSGTRRTTLLSATPSKGKATTTSNGVGVSFMPKGAMSLRRRLAIHFAACLSVCLPARLTPANKAVSLHSPVTLSTLQGLPLQPDTLQDVTHLRQAFTQQMN